MRHVKWDAAHLIIELRPLRPLFALLPYGTRVEDSTDVDFLIPRTFPEDYPLVGAIKNPSQARVCCGSIVSIQSS
jgi:hypothetical protein